MKLTSAKQGFTLIELIVVIAIGAIIMTLVVGAIVVARNTSTEATNRANANTLRVGYESAYARGQAYCGAIGTPACTVQTFELAAGALTAAGIPVTLKVSPTPNESGNVTAINARAVTLRPNNYNDTGTLPDITLP